ncbi:MAG: TrkA family potassium uptake protein [Clostridia bacterium]|nr:TrkA family potassium uptake protein [Clostridia bacterium]
MKESYMVLGLGRFGEAVSKSLYAKGYEVLAIDEDEEIINEIQNHVTHAIVGDCTDESVLKAVGARNFDGAIVAVGGKIETSILSTVLLRELGVNFIVARAATELHGRILKKVGADRVVLPERDMGIKFVQSLASSHIVDMIELSEDHSIVEVRPLPSWIGKTLDELNMRKVYGVTVMAAKEGRDVVVSPRADYKIQEDDILVVVGHNRNIDKIREK